MTRRAVFLDRDGVLIADTHLLIQPEYVRICPRAAEATRALAQAGYVLIVVSNQTVVARGLASEDEVHAVNRRIAELLSAAGGGPIAQFYLCFHHPSADHPQYRVDCDCRKPRPGLLLRAAQEFGLNLAASYMVGDRISDIAAGRRAGCVTVLVETGMHAAPPIESADLDTAVQPDAICPDLLAAARWILQRDHAVPKQSAVR